MHERLNPAVTIDRGNVLRGLLSLCMKNESDEAKVSETLTAANGASRRYAGWKRERSDTLCQDIQKKVKVGPSIVERDLVLFSRGAKVLKKVPVVTSGYHCVWDTSGMQVMWAWDPFGDHCVHNVRTHTNDAMVQGTVIPQRDALLEAASAVGYVKRHSFRKVGSVIPEQVDLEVANPVPCVDGRVVLHDAGSCPCTGPCPYPDHTYIVDGKNDPDIVSCTTFGGSKEFFSKFEEVEHIMLPKTARNPTVVNKDYYPTFRAHMRQAILDTEGECDEAVEEFMTGDMSVPELLHRSPREDLHDMAVTALKQTWSENSVTQSSLGTAMHEKIEFFFLGRLSRACLLQQGLAGEPELLQFLHFRDTWVEKNNLVPWRMELRMLDDALKVCGSVDGIFMDTTDNKLVVNDWKRSKEITLTGSPARTIFADLPDCKYVKYSTQLNFYKYIIEQYINPLTGEPFVVKAIYITSFHPNQESYEVFPIEIDLPRIQKMVAVRKAQLQV